MPTIDYIWNAEILSKVELFVNLQATRWKLLRCKSGENGGRPAQDYAGYDCPGTPQAYFKREHPPLWLDLVALLEGAGSGISAN